jgi:hypothetical protein
MDSLMYSLPDALTSQVKRPLLVQLIAKVSAIELMQHFLSHPVNYPFLQGFLHQIFQFAPAVQRQPTLMGKKALL